MATVSKGMTFGATETVTNTKLHILVDDATVTGIVNADISAAAAIAESKLDLSGSGYVTTGGNNAFTGNNTFAGSDSFTTITDLGAVTTADINGGTIDGVTIGASSAPTVTNLGSVTTCDINGGTMDGVNIGTTTATGELIVNDASDNANGLGDQGTAGEVLTSAGAGANPTWATPTSVTQVNDTESSGIETSAGAETTILSVAKTVTSGNTIFLNATGHIQTLNGEVSSDLTVRLKYDSTEAQYIQITTPDSQKFIGYAVSAIVTGLSSSTTFSVTVDPAGVNSDVKVYGNLQVLEF